MRIGVIAPPWLPVPPPAYGGIEAQVDYLARGLADAGHEVLLAARAGSTCSVELVAGTVPAAGVPIGDCVTELAHVVRAYAAFVDVDLVHDHTITGPLCRRRRAGLPVVSTCHGPVHGDLDTVYRAMAAEVGLVAISAAQASAAPDVPFAAVIHHGLDVSAVPVGAGSGGYVCFLGRFSPEKGVREAILIARAAGIPLRIGAKMREASERDYFEGCIRPLLGRDAEYVGELDAAAKYELLGGAMALLNPIRWSEPFGLVMIESLAAGTPVVVTPNGSAPEIIEDGVTGFVRDLRLLPEVLPRATELDRATCRAAAETRFSAVRMVAEHLTLYRTVVAEQGACGKGPGQRPTARVPVSGVPG
ncbi:glycosyltransferase [Modestobacter marinus]|uniref:glycosyltransferase n=1 Tax=Modestobacter marinus TaxID=477641 RepID=UPI001C960680|nr:glycosyltransferase [Modestobacter marinus]